MMRLPNDLKLSLVDECLHLKAYLGQCEEFLWEQKGDKKIRKSSSFVGLCKFLHERDVTQIYPYVNIALRIIRSPPVTNCSEERSFSTLRRVKNDLRATMGNERLTALAILTIERRITELIDYDDLIDSFARNKARKKALQSSE